MGQWDNEEIEKLKSDYEYKITLMSKRISELERENEDARDVMKVSRFLRVGSALMDRRARQTTPRALGSWRPKSERIARYAQHLRFLC